MHFKSLAVSTLSVLALGMMARSADARGAKAFNINNGSVGGLKLTYSCSSFSPASGAAGSIVFVTSAAKGRTTFTPPVACPNGDETLKVEGANGNNTKTLDLPFSGNTIFLDKNGVITSGNMSSGGEAG